MSETASSWGIPGSGGETILGNTHRPDTDARGVVLIVHGFLGYKDYGMFPVLARSFARAGFIAHRFNLSHSGMTNEAETFARPDLFERDTWAKQVADVLAVVEAVRGGRLDGAGLPMFLFGHSRGGDTCLLAAARMSDDDRPPQAVVTASAPASLCTMAESQQQQLLEQGFLEHKSNRTGQTLRIGRTWLSEQLDDPAAHDLCARVGSIACPILFVHGEADPTVPASHAERLVEAARRGGGDREVALCLIPGADHGFCTPNPMPTDRAEPEALRRLIEEAVGFFGAFVR